MTLVTQTEIPTTTRQRPLLWLGVAAAVPMVAAGVLIWSVPREDVPDPGPEATAEDVVRAYVDAVNARDFDTANAIDARDGQDYGRFSRPMLTHDFELVKTTGDDTRAHVLFTASFEGGDGTIEDGPWGYVLERNDKGLWRIIDAGVV